MSRALCPRHIRDDSDVEHPKMFCQASWCPPQHLAHMKRCPCKACDLPALLLVASILLDASAENAAASAGCESFNAVQTGAFGCGAQFWHVRCRRPRPAMSRAVSSRIPIIQYHSSLELAKATCRPAHVPWPSKWFQCRRTYLPCTTKVIRRRAAPLSKAYCGCDASLALPRVQK